MIIVFPKIQDQIGFLGMVSIFKGQADFEELNSTFGGRDSSVVEGRTSEPTGFTVAGSSPGDSKNFLWS